MNGYLLAFSSPHDGAAARRALRGHCPCTLLPTPRDISASCGVAVAVPEEALALALAQLHRLSMGPGRVTVYHIQNEGDLVRYVCVDMPLTMG